MTHPFPLYVFKPFSSRLESFSPPVNSLDPAATLGFGLTLAKIPLTMVSVLLVLSNRHLELTALIVFAIIIDILDGVIFNRSLFADHRGLRESRRIWDSTLDRLLIWSTLGAAVVTSGFPASVFGIIMLREFIVATVTGIPYLRTGFVHAPNLPSKIGATLIGVQVIWHNAGRPPSAFLLSLFLAFSLIGVAYYIKRPKSI